MKYIFGLGLPRTGTNSLGLALHLLGINGECKCILNDFHNKREKDDNTNNFKYIIFNDAFIELETLLDDDKISENKYILTIRKQTEWINSIKNFDKEVVSSLLEIKMDEYIEKIKNIFIGKNCLENLLIINIFTDDDKILWEKLTSFLNLENDFPDEDFPKINLNK
jgi:hypothetical protein